MTVLQIAKLNNMPIISFGYTKEQLEILEFEYNMKNIEENKFIDMEGYGPSGHMTEYNLLNKLEEAYNYEKD